MHAGNTIQHEAQHRQHNSTWSTSTRSTQATPYLCMGQRGQHRQRHTYVWVNTGNAILMYGSTRSTQATPYLCMVNAVNTGNAILMYGSTRATPYLCMGQRGQHRQRHTDVAMGQRGQHRQRHTYVWVNAVNTGNAILVYI